MKIDFAAVKFNVHGTINAVVQDAGTGEVLALAKMDGAALAKTAETGSLWLYDAGTKAVYSSADDGAELAVTAISTTKKGTALLIKAVPKTDGLGVFTQPLWSESSLPVPEPDGIHGVLAELYRLICQQRQFGGEESYTHYLFMSGQDKILNRVGQEATATVIASKNGSKPEVLDEMGSLWYHCLVLLAYHGINPAELLKTMGGKAK